MQEGIVYKWTNNTNNKWYIGSHTGTANDRYTASGVAITRAFKKYGIENFTREILYSGNDFRELEEFLLTTLQATSQVQSYNMKDSALGGSGPCTEASKQKKSQALKRLGHKPPIRTGKTNSELHKSRFSATRKGHKHSELTRKKLSEANLGKKKPERTEEHRKNISQSKKGSKLSVETLAKRYVARYLGNKPQEEQNIVYTQKVAEYTRKYGQI